MKYLNGTLAFHIIQLVISLSFHTLKPEKDTPFGRSLPAAGVIVPSRTDGKQNLIQYTLFACIIVCYYSLQYLCCVFDRPRTEAFLIKQHLVYAVGLTQIVLLVSIGAYEKKVSFPAEFSLVQFLISLRRKLIRVWPQGFATGDSHPGLL